MDKSLLLIMVLCLMITICTACDKTVQVSATAGGVQEGAEIRIIGIYEEEEEKENEDESLNIEIEEKVISSPEEYEASKFPLIEAIRERQIYLYGIKPYINKNGT